MSEKIAHSTMKVMDFILKYKRSNHGRSPSIREICDGCNLRSTSNGHYHLARLQRAGLIERDADTARNIHVVGEQWSYSVKVTNA
jgi:repressor LexA